MKLAIVSVLVAMQLVACASPPLSVHQQNQALWTQHKIAHYQYQIEVVCFCPLNFRRSKVIEVIDNQVVGGSFVDTGEAVPEALLAQQKTLNQWLDDISRMQADEPAMLEVEYDIEYGHPLIISSDYSQDMADDELQVMISRFKVIQ